MPAEYLKGEKMILDDFFKELHKTFSEERAFNRRRNLNSKTFLYAERLKHKASVHRRTPSTPSSVHLASWCILQTVVENVMKLHTHTHTHTHTHRANSVIVSRLAQQPCGKYDCLLFSTGNLHQQDACFSLPHLFTPSPPSLPLSLSPSISPSFSSSSGLNGNMFVKQPQLWKNRCFGKENSVGTVCVLYVWACARRQNMEHGILQRAELVLCHIMFPMLTTGASAAAQ